MWPDMMAESCGGRGDVMYGGSVVIYPERLYVWMLAGGCVGHNHSSLTLKACRGWGASA